MNYENDEAEKPTERSREERLDEIAEELVEGAEINAWEYSNTGNFIYS